MGRSRNNRGVSAVEYGLLLTGITALIVVVIFAFSNSLFSTDKQSKADTSDYHATRWLMTACYSTKSRLGGANPDKRFDLADNAVVDPSTGTSSDDLTKLPLGNIYLLYIDREGAIVRLELAPIGVLPSRC